ncbi:MAG TPA: hypothetical protein VLI90_03655, partial [Tepidisphaeraceae bacterium]|nr:hypothetical protein [Tepidisphaeraceae bacterium]
LSSVVGLKRAIWLASRARKFVPQREATPFLVNVPAPRFDTTTNRAATELPDERKQRQFGVAVP